jgi:hypothetical protein
VAEREKIKTPEADSLRGFLLKRGRKMSYLLAAGQLLEIIFTFFTLNVV